MKYTVDIINVSGQEVAGGKVIYPAPFPTREAAQAYCDRMNKFSANWHAEVREVGE